MVFGRSFIWCLSIPILCFPLCFFLCFTGCQPKKNCLGLSPQMPMLWLKSQNHPRRRARAKVAKPRLSIMPEAFSSQFAKGWDMIHHQKKRSNNARTDYKGFGDTGLSGGISTKAFQIGNGQCSLPSTHLFSTPWPCVASIALRIVTSIILSFRRNLTKTLL